MGVLEVIDALATTAFASEAFDEHCDADAVLRRRRATIALRIALVAITVATIVTVSFVLLDRIA